MKSGVAMDGVGSGVDCDTLTELVVASADEAAFSGFVRLL